MATLQTLYGPGSVTTQTPGIDLPAFTPSRPVDLSPLAALFFARRREQEQAQRPQVNMIQSRALAPEQDLRSVFGASPSGIDEEAKNAALRRSIIENEQAVRPAPQRIMHGAGVVPGYVMDALAMNQAQREAFLPKGSDMIPGELFKRPAYNPYSDEARAGSTGWGLG